MKKFLPFAQLGDQEQVIAIDCYAKEAFNLSHWRGAPKVANIHDDTSAQITIHAIEESLPQVQRDYVTCNHFDIDGFLGVWSVFNPDLALQNKALIEEMSLIGDFRELNEDTDLATEALKLVCAINHLEKRYFYAPFAFKTKEAQTCVDKFNYFLTAFSKRLFNINRYQNEWEKEFDLVNKQLHTLDNDDSHITNKQDLRLQIVETANPLHYYALFAKSGEYDMVLSLYDHNRYELECKYTTWVDTNRVSYPRIDLKLLAARLNTLEKSGLKWEADPFTDTGPILRLNKEKLPKEVRFDHPFARPIYTSSINPDTFKEVVLKFFHEAYHNISPKKWWSWREIELINMNLKALLA